jgi:hypothetical protein
MRRPRLKRVDVGVDRDDDVRARDRNSLGDQLAAARQRIAELEDRQWQLEHRDPLTGNLLSLRAFRTQLELDVARADRYSRPPSG